MHLVRLVLVLGSLLLLETAEGVRLCWGRGRPMIRITSCHRWRQGQMRVLLGLLLLLALCQAGAWTAAAALYGSDVSSLLEQLCGFVDPGVQALVQRLYR